MLRWHSHCDIATAHIAGYSLDGKIRGTEQIYQAFCQHFALDNTAVTAYPAQTLLAMQLSAHTPVAQALRVLCRAVYDPRSDDAAFRLSLQGDEGHVVQPLIRYEKTTPCVVKFLICRCSSVRIRLIYVR